MPTTKRPPLFTKLNEQLRRYWHQLLDDADHGVLAFPPNAFDQVAQALFSNLSQGGFATFVVSGRRNWDPRGFYFEAARRAARRGIKIDRAFLLPHKQYLNEQSLRLHWKLDTQAGISVKFLYVGDLLSSMLSVPSFSLDFGIWDDSLVCMTTSNQLLSSGEPAEWRLSMRGEDLELARNVRDELLAKAIQLPNPDQDGDLLDLEEPMVKTAPLMELLSDAVCAGSYLSEDCSWYHGAWQYLRILDLVSTPTWHPSFYIPELRRFADRHDNPRILISGTADYSTLAHVLWVFGEKDKNCQVTVLDLCQTPLILCKWYAQRVGDHIETVQQDILSYEPENKYHLIVTDAFLTRFPKLERSAVTKSWANLLQPGGCVITTCRIRTGANTSKQGITTKSREIEDFRARAIEQGKRWNDFLPLSIEEIGEKARRYAERIVSYPFLSPVEVREEFETAGFEVMKLYENRVKGEMESTVYAEVIARRRL